MSLRFSTLGIAGAGIWEARVPAAGLLFAALFGGATLSWRLSSAPSFPLGNVVLANLVHMLLGMPRIPAEKWNPPYSLLFGILALSGVVWLAKRRYGALGLAFDFAHSLLMAVAIAAMSRSAETLLLLAAWFLLPPAAVRLAIDSGPVAEWLSQRDQRLTGVCLAAFSLVVFASHLYPRIDAGMGGGAPISALLESASDALDAKPTEVKLLQQSAIGVYVESAERYGVRLIPFHSIRSLVFLPGPATLAAEFVPTAMLLVVIIAVPWRAYIGPDPDSETPLRR